VSVEECLQEYPGQAEDLAPLLEIAEELHENLSPPAPDEVFVSTSPTRLLNQLRASKKKALARKEKRGWRLSWPLKWAWRPAYALASGVLVLILLASSVGVVSASAQALPGDALYGVKRAVEEGRLAMTWTAAGDAKLLEAFAEKRLAEAEMLLEMGRFGDLDLALTGYEELLDRLLEQVEEGPPDQGPGSLEHLLERIGHHTQVLQRVQAQVPEKAQAAIEHAIERSQHGAEVITILREGGSPSDVAPGQLKKNEEAGGPPENTGKGRPPTKTPKPKKDKKP
jgi:hypothetical protein